VLREAIIAEAAEVADYLVLGFEAVRAGDASTEVIADELRMEERLTLDALRRCWHQAARRDVESRGSHTDAHALIVRDLQMAHTVEQVAAGALLSSAPLVPSATARARMDDHRANSRRQARDIAERLHHLGARLPMLPVLGNMASSIAVAPLHLLRAPRPKRIVRDLYVLEFLEIATYEQLAATAELLGDECTAELARRHIPEELAMADWIERHVDGFVM
jgi:ferritin-like metal-binding protein YciE